MCSKETIDAIDTGKAKVIKTWQLWGGLVIFLITAFGFVLEKVTNNAVWKDDVEELMFDSQEQKINSVSHPTDEDVHMKFEEKIKVFVPRTEYMEHIKQFDNFNSKLDKIYEILIERN